MANSYSISQRIFQSMAKLFFQLLEPAIVNSYILHSSCGGKKISHRDFRYTLVRNILAHAGLERRIPRLLGRPPNVESQATRLEVCGSKHWPTQSETQLRCRIRPGVRQKKFSWSAVRVTWDCVWNKHVTKTTTPRHNCKNIWCDLPKKNLGLKTIHK